MIRKAMLEKDRFIELYYKIQDIQKKKLDITQKLEKLREPYWTNYKYNLYKWAIPDDLLEQITKLEQDRQDLVEEKIWLYKEFWITKQGFHSRASQYVKKWIIT